MTTEKVSKNDRDPSVTQRPPHGAPRGRVPGIVASDRHGLGADVPRELRLWIALIALALVLALAASARAEERRGLVTGARRGVVYVSWGSMDGVVSGTRLQVAGMSTILEATEVGERQCSAKVVQGVAPSRGAQVVAPPPPKADVVRKPPKTLPEPRHLPKGAGEETVATLRALPREKVTFKAPDGGPVERETTVHGDLQVSYVGIFDTAPDARQDMDLHAVRVRNRLDVEGIAGEPVAWQHDIGFRGDFGPSLSERPGSRSRPWVEVRRAAISWTPSLLSLSGGRLALPLAVQGGLLDGASVSAEVAEGAHLGAYGGLSPDLLDLVPAADIGRFGVDFDWLGDLGDVQVGLTGALGGSTWQGSLDRTALSLSTSVYWQQWLTVFADATLDAYTDFNPAGRPVVDLSDAFVVARTQPVPWLSIDAHYAFHREVLTRELADLLPDLADIPPVTEPMQSAFLQTTFIPLPWLSVSQSAGLGFGNEWSEGLWLRTRLDMTRLPVIDTGIHLGYSYQESPVTRVQVGSLRLSQPVSDEVRLLAGYSFVTSQLRRLDERYDQHQAEGGVEVWLPWGLVVDAMGNVILDDTLGPVVTAAVHGGWRF